MWRTITLSGRPLSSVGRSLCTCYTWTTDFRSSSEFCVTFIAGSKLICVDNHVTAAKLDIGPTEEIFVIPLGNLQHSRSVFNLLLSCCQSRKLDRRPETEAIDTIPLCPLGIWAFYFSPVSDLHFPYSWMKSSCRSDNKRFYWHYYYLVQHKRDPDPGS